MCRNNNTIVPMSRFKINNNEYSFIYFEDPYNVIQNMVYEEEDNSSSVSDKLITCIYYLW